MNLLYFIENFPDESRCKVWWNSIQDKEGVVCVRCDVERKKGSAVKTGSRQPKEEQGLNDGRECAIIQTVVLYRSNWI